MLSLPAATAPAPGHGTPPSSETPPRPTVPPAAASSASAAPILVSPSRLTPPFPLGATPDRTPHLPPVVASPPHVRLPPDSTGSAPLSPEHPSILARQPAPPPASQSTYSIRSRQPNTDRAAIPPAP